MRLLLLASLLALPAAAQNTYDIGGTTVGAPTADLPAFGATPSGCQLAGQAEPYQVDGFRGTLAGSYTVSIEDPVASAPDTDDTVLLLYRGPFDPANPCADFVAVGNETPGSGLTATLDADQPYALVVAGFLGAEDDYAVRITGPDGGEIVFDALPVELVAFDAVRAGADVRLTWATASETGNARFEIEAAGADGAWRLVGQVAGAGTTLEAQRYAFVHQGAPPTALRYRLRQVDLDGAFEVGPVVELGAALEAPLWLGEVAPHPAGPGSVVAFAAREAAPVVLAAYDALGRHVRTLYRGTPGAGVQVRAPLGDVPAGLYVLRLSSDGVQLARTLVVAQ